jgi:Cof subfamily protein (haloacid dehalogenase superfamily)
MPLAETTAIPAPTKPESATLRLAAIDLDGTLLGPDIRISPENRHAVERLQDAGLEVVIASGRHYLSTKPFADSLPDLRWLVSAQGGEISDVARENVLHRVFLEPDQVQEILEMAHRLNFTAMLYQPEGIFTESELNGDLDFYTRLSGLTPTRVSRSNLETRSAFKIVWVAPEMRISSLRNTPEIAALQVQTVQSNPRLYEFMPTTTSKGTALELLGRHLGLGPENAVVFGDAENDIPMFDWAGHSVAMDHGWPAAKSAACFVTPTGAPETAFARAVDLILQKRNREF